MDVAAELGRNPVSYRFSLSMEMSRLTRDGTAEPVSRDQIPRHAQGHGNIIFPCSADHEEDWQPYPLDPYSAICDDHIHTYTCYMHIHKIRLHGRRGRGIMAASFSRKKLRQAPQKEGGEIMCDLPPVCVTPAGTSTNLTSRINGMITPNHTHAHIRLL